MFRSAAGALVATLLAGPVAAHHGWSWTESGFFQIEGVVVEVYVGNPHPTIDLDVEGEIWRIELAPPGASARAGFVEGTVEPGDEVTAIGNRSLDPTEPRMKAIRIVVDGVNYDVYPDRAAGI